MLMELEMSRQFFEKYSNAKFRENLSIGSRDVPWGQTDINEQDNHNFSQFCEGASS